MSKVKIILVQTTNQNFGDTVIAENTAYLLRKALPFWKKNEVQIIPYSFRLEDLWQIRYADAVVFAGGGLIKFRQETYYQWVSDIIKEAQKWKIPVFMNSVGVESYDPDDERCMMLKNAINLDCVKGITIRDDMETFVTCYQTNPNIRVQSVYDPAVWSREAYEGCESRRTEYVGLGVARGNIFVKYGNPDLDEEALLKFWSDVIRTLDEKNIPWKIFTNGLNVDEEFAEKLLVLVGHGEKVPQPVFAEELVRTITTFRSMIACRMHANILAYAYQIPSIGLIWNHKLEVWGDKIGYPERFLHAEEMDAGIAVNRLLQAEKEGCKGPGDAQKAGNYQELKWFVKNWCKKKQIPVQEKLAEPASFMAAAALGGSSFKYKNMNSLQVFEQSYSEGYRIFEADVRMTSDEKLVCVNGWGRETYKMFGLPFPEQGDSAMTYQDFKNSRYYQHFDTAGFEELIQAFAKHAVSSEKKLKLILDIGKPKGEQTKLFFQELIRILKSYGISEKDVIVRFQRNRDIKLFKKEKYNCRIAHYIHEEDNPEIQQKKTEEVLSFCEQENIHLVSMSFKLFTDGMAEEMRAHQMKSIILSCTKLGEMYMAAERGAIIVGSHYYSPEHAMHLIEN